MGIRVAFQLNLNLLIAAGNAQYVEGSGPKSPQAAGSVATLTETCVMDQTSKDNTEQTRRWLYSYTARTRIEKTRWEWNGQAPPVAIEPVRVAILPDADPPRPDTVQGAGELRRDRASS